MRECIVLPMDALRIVYNVLFAVVVENFLMLMLYRLSSYYLLVVKSIEKLIATLISQFLS